MNEYTIIVPTRNNLTIANDFLKNCLYYITYDIILIDDFSDSKLDYIEDSRITIVYNKEKKSLTQLWNQGIKLTQTDNVIICSHKTRPTHNDFLKNIELLNQGFGLVALGGFHFFSFNKFLCTKIGFFDEGFKTGWYEDNDCLNKLVVNDISYYLSEEIFDLKGSSGWELIYVENKQYYESKWIEHGETIIQTKNDQNIDDIHYYKDITPIDYTTHKNSIHLIMSYRFYKYSKKNC
jgi:hypothetical protein